MTIFVDVDGTLTQHQRKNALDQPRPDVIDAVRKLKAQGHTIVIWTSTRRHALNAIAAYQLDGRSTSTTKSEAGELLYVAKPDMIVDNQVEKWGTRLKRRVISPERFVEWAAKQPSD